MRIALLSDVHASLEALNACLAHALARDADQLAFLGDLVGYGADATAVVAFAAGSAAYVSPEQLESNRSDPRSELFALGVVLYQQATGALPFGESQQTEVGKESR